MVTFKDETFNAVGIMSHYKPNLPPKPNGDHPNCEVYNFETRYCDSAMRTGEAWEDWERCSLACPEPYLYSLWTLPGGEIFICLDTGEKVITKNSSVYLGQTAHWLDLLLKIEDTPPVPYGTEIPVSFKFGEFVPFE